MEVRNIDHLNLSVADLAASVDWYGRLFGFELVEQGQTEDRPWAILRSHDALLCLYEDPQRRELQPEVRPPAEADGFNHFGLRICDRGLWEETLQRESVEVLYGGVVQWPRSLAWYVRDPSGYEIEVALWRDNLVQFD